MNTFVAVRCYLILWLKNSDAIQCTVEQFQFFWCILSPLGLHPCSPHSPPKAVPARQKLGQHSPHLARGHYCARHLALAYSHCLAAWLEEAGLYQLSECQKQGCVQFKPSEGLPQSHCQTTWLPGKQRQNCSSCRQETRGVSCGCSGGVVRAQ